MVLVAVLAPTQALVVLVKPFGLSSQRVLQSPVPGSNNSDQGAQALVVTRVRP